RVREMVRVNVHEALGQGAADRACGIADAAASWTESAELPAYGDGRLAPHEWLRTPDGRILKFDCGGHESDHTIVGQQPVLWDVAGAIVEWDVRPSDRHVLLGKPSAPETALKF